MNREEGFTSIRSLTVTLFCSSQPRGKEWRMMREEQEKLQEAASATIGSMRALLEEKNIEIERSMLSPPCHSHSF